MTILLATVDASAGPANYELASTVDSGGKLEGCGVRVAVDESTVVTVTLHRARAERTDGALEVTVESPGVGSPGATMTLATTVAGTVGNFSIHRAPTPDELHATAEVHGDDAALLMRDVLLSGATLMVTPADNRSMTIRVDGPAVPDVVRGYLQCAGNMRR